MRPLALEDIKNLHEYELERPVFRQRVIEVKKKRRIPLGPFMTLVFENRDTVRFQVQEMVRIERIVRPDRVQEEVDVYNELLPGPEEVAATLFIEVTEYERIQPTLDQFVGLDEPGRLALVVGPRRYPALFAGGQSREDRISAVHYVRFHLGREGQQLLARREAAALEVDHAGYQAHQTLQPETVEELLRDLSD
jgi:hypothetical protein